MTGIDRWDDEQRPAKPVISAVKKGLSRRHPESVRTVSSKQLVIKSGWHTVCTPYPATWVKVKDKDQVDHPGEPGCAIIHQPPGMHQLIRSVAFADPTLWVRREGGRARCRDTGILEAQRIFASWDLAARIDSGGRRNLSWSHRTGHHRRTETIASEKRLHGYPRLTLGGRFCAGEGADWVPC